MRETAIVSSAPGDLHDGVRMSTTSEGVVCWSSYAPRIKGLVVRNNGKSRA